MQRTIPKQPYAVTRKVVSFVAVDRANATTYPLEQDNAAWRTHLDHQATVTVGVIAKELGVSDTKVKKAIEALKIEPIGKRGVCKLYATDVVEAIRKTLA